MRTGLFLKELLKQVVTLWPVRIDPQITQIKYFAQEYKDEKHMRNMSFCKSHKKLVKRLFDLAVAILSVIVLSPFLIFIGILVRMRIGTPMLFRQVRPGLYGRTFVIYSQRVRGSGQANNL